MANHKTGSQRYNDRMDKIFDRAKSEGRGLNGNSHVDGAGVNSPAMKKAKAKALDNAKDPKRMMANERGKYLFNKVMDGGRKDKKISKLVENAPEGSALRPWDYDKKKYM